MDFVDGNTSDPGTEPARGSDIPEDREDNSELMQAGIVGANDKSEEAVLTDDQTQSPPSARYDELRSHLHDEDKGTLLFDAGSNAANTPWLGSTATILTLDEEMLPVRPLGATAAAEASALVHRVPENCAHLEQVLQRREELEQLRRQVEWREQWIRQDRERRQGRESEMQEGDVQSQQQQLVALACSQQQLKFRKEVQENDHCPPECCIGQELLKPAIAECCTLPCLQRTHRERKDKLFQHGEMDLNAGKTSDPATVQASGSDTLEDSEDNNEPMQAGILGANDKSEEAVLTDGQFQSPPSARYDKLQGAIIDASGSAEESASALQEGVNEACVSLDQVLLELELIRGSVFQGEQLGRESEMRECEVQPQQQQLAVPAHPQQVLLNPAIAECCTLPCLQKTHRERKDKLFQHGEMDLNAGNTSDPATVQARCSDTLEDSEDNNEPMQAGTLGANDKSEEAVLTDGQFQSPPSARYDELQGAIIDASGSAEESASALQEGVNEACVRLDQVLLELELIRRSVVQGEQLGRESEMRECEAQPQQQQLAVPAHPQQVVQENDHCLPECCICLELLDPVIAECCTLHCPHKVHKECMDQLVQYGYTKCPICRHRLSRLRE